MSVSEGNSKIGAVPNVSLLPIVTCPAGVPCARKGQCYALKSLMYPGAKASWTNNTAMARDNPDKYFKMISDYLDAKKPRYFRWHVVGDILDQNYLDNMKAIALEYPDTRFLAFTKRHTLNYSKLPANLSIVFSLWPGLPRPKRIKEIRFAWMQDGSENRIPKDSIECPGSCEQCMMCWSLNTVKRDVYFLKH